jgi:hypothetical protein
MDCSVLVVKGTAYIPTIGDGPIAHVDVEPVEVVPVLETEALGAAIRRTIARGHPKVNATPAAKDWVLLKHTKVRSRSALEQIAKYWHLMEYRNHYEVQQWKCYPTGGWIPDKDREEVLPSGTSLEDAVKRFVEVLQSSLSGDWNPKRVESSK